MRLRVKIRNSIENRISLMFQDLCVKYSNGFSPALSVQEGDEIPIDVLDPEDVRKSLLVGTLKAYLANGWIEEIPEEKPKKPEPVPVPKPPVAAQEQVEMKHEDLPQDIPPMQPEKDKILAEPPVSVVQPDPITDLNKVSSYEDFCKLTHLLKLRFIKETTNTELLKSISLATPSSQFKNNIQLRLSQIK